MSNSNGVTLIEMKPDDWAVLRAIRLEALRENPEFFCPSQDENAFTEDQWRERLENRNSGNFVLKRGDEPVGLTAIVIFPDNPREALCVASYIRKEYRGKGLSKLFYEARIDWARRKKEQGIERIVVEHRDDNLASKAANQAFGFKLVGEREQKWPDGQTRPCLTYHLDI